MVSETPRDWRGIKMPKCEMCPKNIEPIKVKGNFYIEVMNQSRDNGQKGEKPYDLYFCSWECLENFQKQEN